MKRVFLLLILTTCVLHSACTQNKPEAHPTCLNPEFDQKVSQMISFTVPTIGVSELKDIQNEVYIFDTRNREEYEVSHIPNARYLGYSDFDPKALKGIPIDAAIVLYCSIGYRSEKIGEKLLTMGYSNVLNLYGSIFEWVNQGNPVVDQNGRSTHKVHTYNQQWSRWLDGTKAEKVW